MSTLKALSTPSTKITLGENEPLPVYGFSARHIANLLKDHPQLIEVFREVRVQAAAAAAKADGVEFSLKDLIVLAVENAVEAIGNGGLSQAVLYALHENPKSADEWEDAFEAVDLLPLEWQIRIISEAFANTMPEATANFRKAMEKSATSQKNETVSKTGSDE
jgi:hypothetical protein